MGVDIGRYDLSYEMLLLNKSYSTGRKTESRKNIGTVKEGSMSLLKIAEGMSSTYSENTINGVVYPRYLFHRTKEENLTKILESNKLVAGTRSRCEDVRVSMSTKTNRKEFGPITLVIDADKLRQDYTVREFDYDKSMGQYAYEDEWYTGVDVTNLSKYIVDIISDYDFSYDRLYCYSHINEDIAKIISLPRMGQETE